MFVFAKLWIIQMSHPEEYHLRIFLVSHCNLRCVYCNPDAEYERSRKVADQDVLELLSAAASCGIRRVHYSGGEPTLRKNLPSILMHARDVGFEEQVITTNGLLLPRLANELKKAGLCRVNLSLDSLDRERNRQITGIDGLAQVREAIDVAVELFGFVKLNVVLLRSNIDEVPKFVELSERYEGKVIVRFIELQSNQPVFFKDDMNDDFVPMSMVNSLINEIAPAEPVHIEGENPNCSYFKLKGRSAIIGQIANVSRGYPCGHCKKIRISPYGDAGVCINAEGLNIAGKSLSAKREAIEKLMEVREQLDVVRPNRKHLSDAKGFWRWGDVSNGKKSNVTIIRN